MKEMKYIFYCNNDRIYDSRWSDLLNGQSDNGL